MTENAVRTYEIVTTEGIIRMDIPESWKVTYGPVSPGAKGGYSDGGNAFRVYEADTKQRAIFLGVKSFRDLSIPVQRLLVKHKGSEKYETGYDGSRSRSSKSVVERKWITDEEYQNIGEGDEA